jgi:hypothetical protein
MKLSATIKKLERNGFTVRPEACERHSVVDGRTLPPSFYYAEKPGAADVIEVCRNGEGDDVSSIKVRNRKDEDDLMTDYFGGMFCDSVAQAIRLYR